MNRKLLIVELIKSNDIVLNLKMCENHDLNNFCAFN